MKLLQSTVVLCALSVALTVLAAEEGQTFSQWEQTSGVQAKTAGGYYDKKEVKHICLKEKEQHNCRYVGCPSLPDCIEGNGVNCNVQYDCKTHIIAQSDLECCHDEHGYDDDASNTLLPSMKAGTCDWDVDIYQCNEGLGEICSSAIPMANGAFKVGTAWATCYLNSDSEYCGSPLCDRMVLTFQGGLYGMPAYSKTEGPDFEDSCFSTVPFVDGGGGGDIRQTAKKSHMSALSKSLESTGLLQKLFKKYPELAKKAAAKTGAKLAYIQPPPPTNSSWYEGIALMMSGPVKVTSMDKQVECNSGMLEYVPFYLGVPTSDVPGKTAMVVKPNSYDITLSCDGKGYEEDEYKKDDYYKKDENKEDEYKQDDYYKKDEYKNRY